MALEAGASEAVISKVSSEARKEFLGILEGALKEALSTLDRVRQDADLEASKIRDTAAKQAEIVRRRIQGSAEFSARNMPLQTVEEVVVRAFDEAIRRIDRMPPNAQYDGSLRALLEEAIEAIGSDKLIVYGNIRDQDLIRRIAQDVARTRKLDVVLGKESIGCAGGVMLKSQDQSVIFDNTVEARLERLKAVLRKELTKRILS